jgi:hypothetical protein
VRHMVRDDARRRRRSRLLWATLGAGLLVLLFGVGEMKVGIREPHGTPGSSVLGVGVASCNANPRVQVEETATTVTLTARVDRPGILDGTGDCRDNASLTLRAPLGARTVVDGSTGEVVPVSPGE